MLKYRFKVFCNCIRFHLSFLTGVVIYMLTQLSFNLITYEITHLNLIILVERIEQALEPLSYNKPKLRKSNQIKTNESAFKEKLE